MDNYDNESFTKLSEWENKCLQLIVILKPKIRKPKKPTNPKLPNKAWIKNNLKKKLTPEKLTFPSTSGIISSLENC